MDGTEEIKISLTREQIMLYGLTLNNAIAFLANRNAPSSIVENLEELKQIFQEAQLREIPVS